MRFAQISIPLCAALFTLSACATVPPAPAGPAASAPQASAPPQNRLARLLAQAGRPDAPSLDVVQRGFGPADISRQDGAGLALTYRMDQCALLLLFTADPRNAMRLAEAHPGPRQAGGAAPSLEQCAAEAGTRPGAHP